jgi:hypothetical protein
MALRHALVVGLLAAGVATPALAQIRATASIVDLGYTVSDLDPDDGIAPTLTVGVPDAHMGRVDQAHVWLDYTLDAPGGRINDRTTALALPGSPVLASYAKAHGSAEGHVTGRQTWTSQAVSVGATVGNLGNYEVTVDAEAIGDSLAFTLAPRTRVSFTATINGWADGVGADPEFYGLAQILGGLRVMSLTNPNSLQFTDGELFWDNTLNPAPLAFEYSLPLSVSFDNLSDAPAYVETQIELDMLLRTMPISAIPEPAPFAMLLAGGLLLGLRRRPG